MWTWLLKLVPKISPLAEAQRLNYETQITLLKSQHEKTIEKLESENRNLSSEIDRLEKEAHEKLTHKSDPPEVQARMMTWLAARGPTDEETISRLTGQSREATKFHLDELFRASFVTWSSGELGETLWGLDHEGRRYLIERRLLH